MATVHQWSTGDDSESFIFATHLPRTGSRVDFIAPPWTWPAGSALFRRGLKILVSVEDEEVASVLQAFGGFSAVLNLTRPRVSVLPHGRRLALSATPTSQQSPMDGA